MAAWGKILLLDLYGCPKHLIDEPVNILAFKNALIPAIDMKSYGEPKLEHFATHSDDAAGYSLVQLIETSALTAHFAENLGQIYLEIFSCKDFDEDDVIRIAHNFFKFTSYDMKSLYRGGKQEGEYKIVDTALCSEMGRAA